MCTGISWMIWVKVVTVTFGHQQSCQGRNCEVSLAGKLGE